MSTEQCWAMNRDGSRCEEPATPESRFCRYHGRNGGPSPLWIWRPLVPETAVAAPEPPPAPDAPAAAASGDPQEVPMDWFVSLLQQSRQQVMAGEGTPIQKANVIPRLGGLYLKASRAAELARTNKELMQRVAALEKRLAAANPSRVEAGAVEEARFSDERPRQLAGPDEISLPSSPSPEPAARSRHDPVPGQSAAAPLSEPGAELPDTAMRDSGGNGRPVSAASPARCASP
jgi:hypothetical protein